MHENYIRFLSSKDKVSQNVCKKECNGSQRLICFNIRFAHNSWRLWAFSQLSAHKAYPNWLSWKHVLWRLLGSDLMWLMKKKKCTDTFWYWHRKFSPWENQGTEIADTIHKQKKPSAFFLYLTVSISDCVADRKNKDSNHLVKSDEVVMTALFLLHVGLLPQDCPSCCSAC